MTDRWIDYLFFGIVLFNLVLLHMRVRRLEKKP